MTIIDFVARIKKYPNSRLIIFGRIGIELIVVFILYIVLLRSAFFARTEGSSLKYISSCGQY